MSGWEGSFELQTKMSWVQLPACNKDFSKSRIAFSESRQEPFSIRDRCLQSQQQRQLRRMNKWAPNKTKGAQMLQNKGLNDRNSGTETQLQMSKVFSVRAVSFSETSSTAFVRSKPFWRLLFVSQPIHFQILFKMTLMRIFLQSATFLVPLSGVHNSR